MPPRNSRNTAANGSDTPAQDPYEGLSDEKHNEFVGDLLKQAGELQDEKSALLERIGANRDTLRTVAKTGMLSEKQRKAIDLTYPPRAPKTDAEGETPATPETTPAAA